MPQVRGLATGPERQAACRHRLVQGARARLDGALARRVFGHCCSGVDDLDRGAVVRARLADKAVGVTLLLDRFLAEGVQARPFVGGHAAHQALGQSHAQPALLVGTGLFAVFSLTRYFRYWLVRLIFEQRDQTDRIVGPR